MSTEGDRLFKWKEEGSLGLQISGNTDTDIRHEILSESGLTSLKENPIFLGNPVPRWRYLVMIGGVLLIVGILIGRAFWMQGIRYAYYQELADRNRLRQTALLPIRGLVTDRNGVVLAENISTFDVSVIPIDLPKDEKQRYDILGQIARIAGSSIQELEQAMEDVQYPQQALTLIRDIPYDQAIALKIQLADFPAVEVEAGQKRRYPESAETPTLSHVLGYVGKISPSEYQLRKDQGYRQTDLVGKAGVEAAYEALLRGKLGKKVREVDAYGREQRAVLEEEAQAGEPLALSLDLELQKKTEQALRKGIEQIKGAHGAAIVLDPRNGDLLAIASIPAYDNDFFSGQVSSTWYAAQIQDPNMPFLPRAWAGLYPSGSTIKPIYAIAALVEGVITPQTTFNSVGGVFAGTRFFPDWKPGGHGLTDVRKAIAWSVNTFFYLICGGQDKFEGLGVTRMGEWLRRFGFGSPTGLDITGELSGFVPSPEWKLSERNEYWFVGDTYNLAIGQGDLLVTPLQIAVATAEIANGGLRVVPHVVRKKEGAEESRVPEEVIAPPYEIQIVKSGMRDTIRYGSGRGLQITGLSAGGKTGTAQWRNDRKNHAWFTAFAPYENPEVVVTVLIEEGEEGSSTALPVAREILQAWSQMRSELY